MVEQSVDQCAVEIARRWVDDEAGGLVDNDQMFVFVSDDEGDILRLVVRQRGVGHRDVQPIPRARALGGIAHHHPVARHRAAGDQHLQPLARQRRHRIGERTVEPPAIGGRRDRRFKDGNPPVHTVTMWERW